MDDQNRKVLELSDSNLEVVDYWSEKEEVSAPKLSDQTLDDLDVAYQEVGDQSQGSDQLVREVLIG